MKRIVPVWLIVLFFGCISNPEESDVALHELDQLPLIPPPARKALPRPVISLDSNWLDVTWLDTTIIIDIRYATTDNFVGEVMYPCARCILRPEVAQAILSVHLKLKKKGLGLKLYDCYRPRLVQEALWTKMPDARYVTPPEKGSMHNRGTAVDVTIIDENGHELDMGTPYDFFGQEAYHTFTGHPDSVLANRELLKSLMLEAGFGHIRTEWWHYSYQRKAYDVSDYQWPCHDTSGQAVNAPLP
jgi:zinc D-Ala-D-Ala dipeptidase